MAHIHGVYDTDTHFILDPVTKELSVAEDYQKVKVIQYDHNSERFTFELPRMIEGHDMSLCNKATVHYLNVDSQTKQESKDIYTIEDLQISPENEDVVICSWLVSHTATKYVGSLYFVLRLECVTDGVIDYALNTLVYEGIYVGKGIYNSDAIVSENLDVLEKWKTEIVKDWNENDETSPSYIKGRTHSVKTSVVREAILDATLTFEEGQNMDHSITLELGKIYEVKWGEDIYNCEAKFFTMEGESDFIILGNGMAFGLDDTGEPFLIATSPLLPVSIIMAMDGAETKAVQIVGEVAKKEYSTLDIGYLPDNMNNDFLMFYVDSTDYMPLAIQEQIESLLAKGVVIGNNTKTLLSFKRNESFYDVVYTATNSLVMLNVASDGSYQRTTIDNQGQMWYHSSVSERDFTFEIQNGVPVVSKFKYVNGVGKFVPVYEPNLLVSPSGKRYKLFVDDNGQIITSYNGMEE